MADQQHAIVGLKRELKESRQRVRALKGQVEGWCRVARTLRSLAGLEEEQFNNLLRAESLTCE